RPVARKESGNGAGDGEHGQQEGRLEGAGLVAGEPEPGIGHGVGAARPLIPLPVAVRGQSMRYGFCTVRTPFGVSAVCCRSMLSKRARKLPSPKPWSPRRWMTS